MDEPDSNLTSPAPAAPTAGPFSFWRTFARHWRESVCYYGWWHSLKDLADACWNALLELLPSHRKARFGDLDYDWEHSVDTTRSNVGAGTQFFTGITARPYFATEPWLFEQMMEALALSIQQSAVSQSPTHNALRDFTFIDLGSGKGRVLLMASNYPFKKIIGVEFMPEWRRLAEANIRKFAATSPGAPPIESLCLDARDFAFPAERLVIYIFNPFAEPVFVAIMERLRQSLLKKPRPVFVAYRYLEFENLLEKCDWLEKVAGTKQWAVYRHLPFGGSK